MEHEQSEPLTKEQLIDKYSDVFNLPVEFLHGEVYLELDPSVTAVLNIGKRICMKLLPGESPVLWRVGTCFQKVAPQSYLVNVGELAKSGRVNHHTRIGQD